MSELRQSASVSSASGRRLFLALGPLALLALLVFAFLKVGPLGVFRAAFPPIEELTIERVTLPKPGEMVVHVVNGGPQAVTVAQVLVDDASWLHYVDGDRTLPARAPHDSHPVPVGRRRAARRSPHYQHGLTFDTTNRGRHHHAER